MNGWAACAGHPEPLWDAAVHGETDPQRVERWTRALAFCRRCPIRDACLADVDLRHDDGVRGGVVLPTIGVHDRRSWTERVPGRSGLGRLRQPAHEARKSA